MMKRGKRKGRRRSGGFTLVEMLISVVLSTAIIASVVAAFSYHRRHFRNLNEVVTMQQNLRPAMERVTRDTRMAGYGLHVPDDEVSLWFPWVANATSRVVVIEGLSPSDPDQLLVIGAFGPAESQLKLSTGVGDTTLPLDPGEASKFNTVDKSVISIGRQETARVIGISGNNLVISTDPTLPAVGLKHAYPAAAPVELLKPVTYQTAVNTNESPALLFLTRNENLITLPPVSDRMVAVNVEDFQASILSSNSVSVELTGRTSIEDEHYIHPVETDGYRREAVQSIVYLRNPYQP